MLTTLTVILYFGCSKIADMQARSDSHAMLVVLLFKRRIVNIDFLKPLKSLLLGILQMSSETVFLLFFMCCYNISGSQTFSCQGPPKWYVFVRRLPPISKYFVPEKMFTLKEYIYRYSKICTKFQDFSKKIIIAKQIWTCKSTYLLFFNSQSTA